MAKKDHAVCTSGMSCTAKPSLSGCEGSHVAPQRSAPLPTPELLLFVPPTDKSRLISTKPAACMGDSKHTLSFPPLYRCIGNWSLATSPLLFWKWNRLKARLCNSRVTLWLRDLRGSWYGAEAEEWKSKIIRRALGENHFGLMHRLAIAHTVITLIFGFPACLESDHSSQQHE